MSFLETEVEVLQAVNYLRFLHALGILTEPETREAINQIVEDSPWSAAGLVWAVRLDTNPL